MKKILFALMTMLLGTVLVAGNAMALPLMQGEINFTGDTFTPLDSSGNTVALSVATGLDFPGNEEVSGATGDFTGSIGSTAAFSTFQFNPLNPVLVAPLWMVPATGTTVFSFDLASVAIDFQTNTQLGLSGTGTLHGTGYDDTAGLWNFTGNTLTGTTFSFSAGSASIPDPAAAFLLGSACLIGFSGLRRKFKK